MEIDTKEIISRVKKMVMVNSFGLMEMSIKDHGIMIKEKVKDIPYLKMERKD